MREHIFQRGQNSTSLNPGGIPVAGLKEGIISGSLNVATLGR